MTDELLQKFSPAIETLQLIPSAGGRFEVLADDALIFSKKSIGRHAEPGEVASAFAEATGVAPQSVG